MNVRASDIGRTILREESTGQNFPMQQLQDIFAAKSTGTLAMRAGPLLKYAAWCLKTGRDAFPVDEQVVYTFLEDLRGKSAPTFAHRLIESLVVSHFAIGLDGAQNAAESRRVAGARKETAT
eukprot:6055288-Amphidinium_carterae.1